VLRTHEISAQAHELKKQIEKVLREEHEAQNPNPLAKLACESYIEVSLLTRERNAHYGRTRVRSDEPILYENRLWIWYQNATWVLEYDAKEQEWAAVEASLPVGRWWHPDERVPASAGAEIRSVLPIKYKTSDGEGREVWKWTEVSQRPAWWDGPDRIPVYTNGTDHFWLGKTVYDYDGHTVYEAELQSVSRVSIGDLTTETIKLLLQTQQKTNGATVAETYIEAKNDDLEKREIDGEELTIYKDEEGHEYEVDTEEMIDKDGVKTYMAVRVI